MVQYIQWLWFSSDGSMLAYMNMGTLAFLHDDFAIFSE